MLVSHLRHFMRLGFRLALVLGYCFSTAAAQTRSANSAPDVALDSSSDLLNWAVPFHRNLLQPDARLIATFVRPWLLDSQVFSASAMSNKSTRTLPAPKTYKLTPDPLNWSLSNTSPDEDDYAYLQDAPHTGYVNTAQRMGELNSGHHLIAHVPAKYDPERIGDREVGEGINFFSIEKEIALGRELSLEVEQSARLLTDPVITQYVNRTGQLLV
jgi:hypothetical protein